MTTSLYSTPPNQDVSSTNSTSLYGGADTPIPDSSGNLVVRGDLIVLSGNILTTATTGNIFPTNATTVNLANSATTVNIGAGTGTTTINNNLTVGGNITGPGADFGNITIAIADDNTITTTTGNLKLGAATNTVQVLNDLTSGGDVTVGDDLTVTGNNVNLAQATVIGYDENNNRFNRPSVRSTTGNQSGFRAQGPNTSVNSLAVLSAFSSSDLNNGRGLTLICNNGTTNPYRIQMNRYIGGVQGSGGSSLQFIDGVNTIIATVNPSGPTVATDLTTKVYVDAHPGTTYDLDATTVAGGANLNLTGSDSTVDTVKFSGAGDTTVTRISANEIQISSSDVDTTYTIDASSTTGGANFNLVGSDSTTDTIKFSGAGGTTVTQITANEIQISSTDSDTTYTIDASSTTGGANLNLVGSDSTTDTVKFANGTGVTVSQINANEMSIAIGQPVAITDNVTFASVDAATISAGAGGVNGSPLYLNSTGPGGGSIIASITDIVPGGSSSVLTATTADLTWAHTHVGPGPGVSGTWAYNIDGTTTFPNYTFPYADGAANQVLKTNGSGILSWAADNNVTYTIDASSTTGGANFNLVGSDSSTDTVKFASGTNVTVSQTSANEITISSTDTNTTYTIDASSTTGGANLNLVGSDLTTDTVKFASGTGVTVSQTNANEMSIAIGQPVATTDDVIFAGLTAGNLTVGLTDNNTITSTDTNGNIVLAPNGTGDVYLDADTVRVGDANTAATITTNGTGDLTLSTNSGTNSGTIAIAQGVNGNITVSPNGTGNLVVTTATDTNITDGNYVLGLLYGSRNTAFTVPASGLSTISGTNGFQAVSSGGGANGYGAQIGINNFSGDTTAGANFGAQLIFRGALGTSTTPATTTSAISPMTINVDGYATSGWASNIATTGSGGGTTSLMPLQIQAYARETFADSAGTVTAAGMGFRVRGFPTATAMSAANRINFIDHTPTTATYKTNTFNVQPAGSTTNYMQLAAASGNINQDTLLIRNNAQTETRASFDSAGGLVRRTVTGTPGVAENRPAFLVELSRTDQATPANGDGVSFRQRTRGSSGTFYTLSDINASYSTTGAVGLNFNLANGDQTGATFSGLTTLRTAIDATTISAGTASATPGGSSVSQILQCTATTVNAFKPIKLNGSTSNYVELSAGVSPAAQTYTLPAAYPTVNNQVLVSTTGGTMSWATSGSTAANYLDANYTTAIGAITANTIYGIPITSLSANNITIATGTIAIDNATATGPTRITFAQTGRYNLQFSIQLENADNAADHQFDIWLRKNGTDVADSNTQYTIVKNNGKNVAALNLLINPTVANDYYELVYAVSNANVSIQTIAAITTPYVRPQTPGIIVTVVPVGA